MTFNTNFITNNAILSQ